MLCQHMRTSRDWASANIREKQQRCWTGDVRWQGWAELRAAAVDEIPVRGAGGEIV